MTNAQHSVFQRLISALLSKAIDARVRERLAAIDARVDDSAGWTSHQAAGPQDRPWSDRQADLDDAFEAWQKNFLVRRIVTLARSYVIGGGITVTSSAPQVAEFVARFWAHEQNRLSQRLAPAVNELIRAGEIFPTLHTNRQDGMSYLRFVPAANIREIKTAENDYEVELEYGEQQKTTAELKWWVGVSHNHAFGRARGQAGGHLKPLMLHYCINREIGCTRGEGDLSPLLPWAKRYTAWLEDRVRLNRTRTRQALLEIKIADDSLVELKRDLLTRRNPIEAGIYVHGPGEEAVLHNLNINAPDAADDGRALRLAVATSANVGLHYLGEGESANYATAKEMGEPTSRYYAERQENLVTMLLDLTAAAYHRACAAGFAEWPTEGSQALGLTANVTEVARADNESLAKSAALVVRALVEMANQGWIDDETAARLAFKFAGEPLGQDEIAAILARSKPPAPSADLSACTPVPGQAGTGAQAGEAKPEQKPPAQGEQQE